MTTSNTRETWEQVLADLDSMPDRQTINAAQFKVLVAALGEVITEQAALLQSIAASQREVTVSQQQLAAAWRDVADELGLTAEDPEQPVRPA